MTVRIREMTERDVDEVYEINIRSFKKDAWSKEAIEREFKLPYSFRYVIEVEGKVVGYSFIWILRKEALIMTFAIDPPFRNKGLGKRFLLEILENLKNKADIFTLDVRKSNLPAIKLYRSLGFSVVKERPRFYSDGENALVMELKVDKIKSREGYKREKINLTFEERGDKS